MRRIVDALGTNEEDESIVDALLAKRVSSFATRPLRRRECQLGAPTAIPASPVLSSRGDGERVWCREANSGRVLVPHETP